MAGKRTTSTAAVVGPLICVCVCVCVCVYPTLRMMQFHQSLTFLPVSTFGVGRSLENRIPTNMSLFFPQHMQNALASFYGAHLRDKVPSPWLACASLFPVSLSLCNIPFKL